MKFFLYFNSLDSYFENLKYFKQCYFEIRINSNQFSRQTKSMAKVAISTVINSTEQNLYKLLIYVIICIIDSKDYNNNFELLTLKSKPLVSISAYLPLCKRDL